MAGQADGSIIIDTTLDTKGFKAGSAELLSAIKSLNSRVEKLQKQMQKVGTQKIATDEYKQVQQDIAQAEKYLDQYNQKRAKLSEKGKVNTSEWRALTEDINAASAELSRLRTLKAEMERTGTAYISGTETADYQSLNAALVSSKQRLVEMQAELARVNSKWAQMPTLTGYVSYTIQNIGSAIKSSFGTVGTAITHPLQAADRLLGSLLQKAGQFVRITAKTGVSKLVSGLKSATSYMANLFHNSKSMNSQFGGLISGAKKFTLSLLGARGVYALLRKAVNEFMSENQQLSNTLSSCWSGIGNLLGPIITRLINLVATAIAYVTQFLALLGLVGSKTSKAISSAGGGAKKETDKLKRTLASFDELNILQNDDSEDGGGGGGGGSVDAESAQPELPDWAKLMAENLKTGKWSEAATILTDQLNSMVASIDWASVGSNVAYWLDGALTFLAAAITTFDWFALGSDLAVGFNNIITGVDWQNLGTLIMVKWIILIDGLGGFFRTVDWAAPGEAFADGMMGVWNAIDWAQAARTISDGVIGLITGLSSAIQSINWAQIGADMWNALVNVVTNIDWSGLVNAALNLLGSALGGSAALLMGFGTELWNALVEGCKATYAYFESYIEDAGGDVIQGLWNGILDALANVGEWIKSNIVAPFINGFKAAFGINSPSTVMAEQGKYIILGLLEGITNAWKDITQFFSTALSTLQNTLGNAWNNIKSSVSTAWNLIKENIDSIVSTISSTVSSKWSNLTSTISDRVDSIKSTISSGFENVRSTMVSRLSSAMETIKNQGWYSVGSNICSGIADGINAGWNWLKTTVSNLASNLLSAAKSALGIHSPSRLFRDAVGLNIGYGIGEGIEGAEGSIISTVSGVADAIADEFNANSYSIGNIGMDVDGNIVRGLDNFSDKVANSFAGLMDRLQAIANSATFSVPRAALGTVVPYDLQTGYASKPHSNGMSDGNVQAIVDAITADLIPAVIAGLEAVVSEQRETRQMIGEIEIGDTVIGQACNRYNRKMAVVHGGPIY